MPPASSAATAHAPAQVGFPDLSSEIEDIFREAYSDVLAEYGLTPSDLESVAPELAPGAVRGLAGRGLVSANQRATEYAGQRAADLVVDLADTTRRALNRMITGAIKDGLSRKELAEKIGGAFGFSDARADLIARTESATAWNVGVVTALQDAGEDFVFVTDGDEFDEACIEIGSEGQIWTVEEALDNPLEHPNCLRQFRPLTPEELAEAKAEGEGFGARHSR